MLSVLTPMDPHRLPQKERGGKPPIARQTSTSGAFSRLVAERLPMRPLTPHASRGEGLVHLDYETEIVIKKDALAAFWREARLPMRPEALVPSPRPRGYRTTTTRIAGREHRGGPRPARQPEPGRWTRSGLGRAK